jgi:hypothetical protein
LSAAEVEQIIKANQLIVDNLFNRLSTEPAAVGQGRVVLRQRHRPGRLPDTPGHLTWLICLVHEFWVVEGVENGLLLGGYVGGKCLCGAVDGDGR